MSAFEVDGFDSVFPAISDVAVGVTAVFFVALVSTFDALSYCAGVVSDCCVVCLSSWNTTISDAASRLPQPAKTNIDMTSIAPWNNAFAYLRIFLRFPSNIMLQVFLAMPRIDGLCEIHVKRIVKFLKPTNLFFTRVTKFGFSDAAVLFIYTETQSIPTSRISRKYSNSPKLCQCGMNKTKRWRRDCNEFLSHSANSKEPPNSDGSWF